MTIEIKQSTAVTFLLGPFVDVTDGVTPETGLATNMDNATTGIRVSKNGAAQIDRNSGTAPTHDDDGFYRINLSTTDTNTLGFLQVQYEELGVTLPAWKDFSVLTANAWDSKYSTDVLQVDLIEIQGGTVPTPTTTGVPDVNVERWLDTLVTLGAGAPDVNVQSMDAASIASGVIAAAELTNIENEIWDALKSAHVVANSFGDFLDIEVSSRSTFAAGGNVNVASMDANSIAAGTIAAGELTNIEDEIWDALKSAHVVANSFGDFLDIEVSSRLPTADITLTGGAVTVGTINANALNAAAIATDAITNTKIAAGAITSSEAPNLDAAITTRATPAEVLTNVNTALDTAISELAQAQPATTPTLRTGLMLLYMALRNRTDTQTSGTDALEIYNNAGTLIAKKLLTDDGSDYSEALMVSGP